MTKTITVKLADKQHAKLKRVAKLNCGCTMAAVVRKAIDELSENGVKQ